MEANELSFNEPCKRRRARATLEDDDADEKVVAEVKEEVNVKEEEVVEEVEKKAKANVLFDQAK